MSDEIPSPEGNENDGAAGQSVADEICQSPELISRLSQFHEALAAGVTLDFTDDETVRRLSGETRERFDRLLGCLKLIDEVRREDDVSVEGKPSRLSTETWPAASSPPGSPLETDRSFPLFPNRVGRFEIRRILGQGGHAVVFEARDEFLHRLVALKLPRPATVLTPELRRRFVREGRIAAGLRHPNIVSVLEAGDFGPGCYIAQELCTGPTLSEWLATQSGPVSVRVAAAVVARLADAVADAHAKGILHRDLKPANVLLQPAESDDDPGAIGSAFPYVPKVTDFGIAKVLDDAGDPTMTMTGIIVGTAAYMSPEQAAGDKSRIGPPSDVYALGAILYELLTRHAPIQGQSPGEIIRRVLIDEPTPLRAIRPEIPADLEAICHWCLAKEPHRRYANAAELADDLGRFLAGDSPRARRLGRVSRLVRQARRRKVSASTAWVGALGAALVVLAVYWQTRQQQTVTLAALEEKEQEQAQIFRQRYPEQIRRADLLLHQWTGGTDWKPIADEARTTLSRYIPKPGQDDLRDFAWRYLWNSLSPPTFPVLHTIRAHQLEAYCVCFSPDGKTVATASRDKTARVWDVESGRLLRTLAGHTHDVNSVAFSPDGKTIATASEDKTIRLWDAHTGKSSIFWTCKREVIEVAFNPARPELAAGTDDGLLKVWDLASHRELTTQKAHTERLNGLAYSGDGKLLATVGDLRVRLWLPDQRYRPAAEYESPGSESVAISPDGRFIALAGVGKAIVYHLPKGESTGEFRLPGGRVHALAFGADGSSLFTVGDYTRFISLATGETWNPFGIRRICWCAARSPDGRRIATTDHQGTLQIWDASRPLGRSSLIDFPLAKDLCFAFSPDGKQLAIANKDDRAGRDIEVWEISEPLPRRLKTMEASGDGCTLRTLAYSPDARFLAVGGNFGSGDDCVQLFDTRTGQETRRLKNCGFSLRQIGFNGDGSILVVQSGGRTDEGDRFQLWDIAASRLIQNRVLLGVGDFIGPFAVSPTGSILATRATSSDGSFELMRIGDRQIVARCASIKEDSLSKLWFYPDGIHLMAETRGHVYVLNSRTEKVEREITIVGPDDQSQDWNMGFSPDGRTLALGTKHGVLLIDAQTGRSMCTLEIPGAPDRIDPQFSPDGQILAAAIRSNGRSRIALWKVGLQ